MTKKGMALILLCGLFSASVTIALASEQAGEGGWDEELYGPEHTIVWTHPVAGTVFEHKVHTVDVGLDCASCHAEDFDMLAGMAEEEDDFTMKAMEEGKYCGNCHYEKGFAYSVSERCTSCHIGVRGVKRMNGDSGEEPTSH